MYASNEDEDWIYLHKTPPMNTILQRAVNLVDDECSNSSSSSSSSSDSSSSKSDRSVSLSSISSTELEHAQNDNVLLSSTDDSITEQENPLLQTANLEDPLSCAHNNIPQTENDNNLLLSQQLISTPIVKENGPRISHDNPTIETNTDTPAAVNEHDVLNTGFELSKTLSLTNSNESLSLPNGLRRRTGVNTQQTDLYNSEVIQSTPVAQDVKPRKRFEQRPNTNDKLVSCTCLIVLLTLPFIFGQIVTQWDQPTMNTIAKELVKTNQRLNEIKDLPIGNLEEKLTKQLEEKLQIMINQQLTWHEHEKSVFISQIRELREILNKTQQNLTNTIHQLINENERLKEQVTLLQHRSEGAEERIPRDKKPCLEGVNCIKPSRLTVDNLVTKIFKQTASVATDTSVNLSGLFERLSASVSDIVDHRHEYVKRSQQKLTDFSGLSTAEKVHTSFRRSVENLASSFRKAKLTYASWVKARAQAREQIPQQTPKKFPWRWTFQRGYNRERIRYQTPNKQHVCYSKFSFPMNKLCSMKNWMGKVFRP